MIQDPPATVRDSVSAPRAAVCLGLALLAGLTIVLLLSVRDRSRRTEDETHEEVTAVGDQSFFKIPEGIARRSEPAVVYLGKPLFIVYKRITNRDSSMVRMGTDDSKTYMIYSERPSEKGASAGEKNGSGPWYLKAALDEYFEVREQK